MSGSFLAFGFAACAFIIILVHPAHSDFNTLWIRECENSPCSQSELDNCAVYNQGTGCSECESGYFKIDFNSQCEQCQYIFGNECEHCQNGLGCGECVSHDEIIDPVSGIQYCESSIDNAYNTASSSSSSSSQQQQGKRHKKDGKNTYDFIVVGAGTGGSVVAAELAKRLPHKKVLLIEEGYYSVANPRISDMSEYESLIEDDTIARFYYSTKQENVNNRRLHLARAQVTGGSGSINWQFYILAHENDFKDRWGNINGWTLDDLLPLWQEIQEITYHDYTEDTEFGDPLMERYINAGLGLGYAPNDDWNDLTGNKTAEGIRRAIFSMEVDYNDTGDSFSITRHSSWTDFVEPILSSPDNNNKHKRDGSNLEVKTMTRVNKLLFDEYYDGEDERIIGVEVYDRGYQKTMNYYVNDEVILSGGAYDSPHILLLSGIGDCDELENDFNIECKVHLPGVGKNLQDHMFVIMFSPPANESFNSEFSDVVKLGWPVYGATAIEENGSVFHHMGAAELIVNEEDSLQSTWMVSTVNFLYHIESTGYTTLRDNDPESKPVVNYNFFEGPTAEHDKQLAIDAIRETRALWYDSGAFDDGFLLPKEQEVWPGYDVQTDEEIFEFVKENVDLIFHPGGSCKMGNTSSILNETINGNDTIVVNERLQVRHIENLRVMDASIQPKVVSANPNSVTILIGYKGAQMIAEDYS